MDKKAKRTAKHAEKRLLRPGGHLYGQKFEDGFAVARRHYTDLEAAIIEECEFQDVSMESSNLKGAKVIASKMIDIGLDHSDLDGIEITSSEMTGYVRHGLMRGARIKDCNLDSIDLTSTIVTQAVVEDTKLSSAVLNNCDFSDATFRRCNLKDAYTSAFSRANLANAEFTDCDMSGVSFVSGILMRASFNGSKLVESKLTFAMLDGADLSGCDMKEAQIDRVYARGANFRNAVLKDATLDCGVFTGADFTGADFGGAYLCRSDFRLAKLDGVSLVRASYNHLTRWPSGFTPPQEAIDLERLEDAKELAAETVNQRTGMNPTPVFIDSPDPTITLDVIYAVYPEFFTVIDRWAFAENLGWAVCHVLRHAMQSIRVGDGSMPYETENDKLYCLIYHLQNAISAAQISATAETFGLCKGSRVKEDKHQMYIYKRLQDELAAARRKSVKNAKDQTSSQAAQ